MNTQYNIINDKPASDLLNHVMACPDCYPRSERYCVTGKALHIASKPSIDVKLVKKQKPTQQAKTDVRRELYTHLLDCRKCSVESHKFCDGVFGLEARYTEWLENTDHGKPIEEVKFEFIGHVASGRIKKWKQLNELSQV